MLANTFKDLFEFLIYRSSNRRKSSSNIALKLLLIRYFIVINIITVVAILSDDVKQRYRFFYVTLCLSVFDIKCYFLFYANATRSRIKLSLGIRLKEVYHSLHFLASVCCCSFTENVISDVIVFSPFFFETFPVRSAHDL